MIHFICAKSTGTPQAKCASERLADPTGGRGHISSLFIHTGKPFNFQFALNFVLDVWELGPTYIISSKWDSF